MDPNIALIIKLLLTSLIVAVGALIQGSAGFGSALVAAPLLVLIDPQYVPGPLMCAMIILNALIIYRERLSIDLKGLQLSILGLVFGTVPAILVLNIINESTFSLIFGSIILLAVIVSFLGGKIKETKTVLFFGGCLSGFMNTISTIGGPPMALIYQHEKGPKLRGMLAGFFLISNIISMVALILSHNFVLNDLLMFLPMIPGVLLGFGISSKLTRIVDRGNSRYIILVIAGFSALTIIFKQLPF